MLKLNKKIEYALISLKHISQKPEGSLSSAKEISSTYSTPFDVTSRVLQILAQNGWLVSEQGAGGGYKLNNIETLSLLELVSAIEGQHAVVKCLKEKKDCPIVSTCNLTSPMEKLNDNFHQFLRSQKVKDLLIGAEENLYTAPKEVINV